MVYNSKLSAIAAAYYHGDLPDNYSSLPPEQQQQILDRIDNNARTNLFMKGVLAFFAPLSPTVSNDYYNKNMQSLRTEFLDTFAHPCVCYGKDICQNNLKFVYKKKNRFYHDQKPSILLRYCPMA